MADGAQGDAPLSARLLVLLTRELAALERASEDQSHGPDLAEGRDGAPTAKARVEAVALVTRTLEKLLELKRLEALSARGDADEDAEAARLAAEMLRRLRALDARRRGGAQLFDARGGYRAAGDGGAPQADVLGASSSGAKVAGTSGAEDAAPGGSRGGGSHGVDGGRDEGGRGQGGRGVNAPPPAVPPGGA